MRTKQPKVIVAIVCSFVIAVAGGGAGWYFASQNEESNDEKKNSVSSSKLQKEKDNGSLFQLEYSVSLNGTMKGNLMIFSAIDDNYGSFNSSSASSKYRITIAADDNYADGMENVDLCFTNDKPAFAPKDADVWKLRDHPGSVCVYGVNHLTVFPHALSDKVDISLYQYALFVERIHGTTIGAGKYQTTTLGATVTPTTAPVAADPTSPPLTTFTYDATWKPDMKIPWTKTELLRGTDDYDIRGTIYSQSRFELAADGVTRVEVPYLLFENLSMVPMPPALFLYISKQTNWARINDDDVFVPVRSVNTDDSYIQFWSFSQEGTFREDFLNKDVNLTDYVGGSWKAWCTTFEIGLAGGIIQEIDYESQ